EKDEISVVNDQVGTPTYVVNLAAMIWRVLEVKPAARIWHFSDAGAISWYEFANAVFAEAKAAGIIDKQPRVIPTRSSDMNFAAPRPAFSVLDKQQTWTELSIEAVHWRRSLINMLAAMVSHG
ncbi:MAG: sugar nucleotide-binding protein, partial [Gammaproteobacteria bacterium]